MILLKAENLSKSYGKVKAVDDVSFSINTGEIFGLLGENGAGKTTVIKMLTTLTKADSGSAFLRGINFFKHKRIARKYVAAVPQEINLDHELTVYENLYIYAKLHGVTDAKERVEEILCTFEMQEKAKARITSLSGGQKRRVMLARVMLGDADLVFMDEPTIGLDPSIRREIWRMIESIKRSGKSVLLTTHYTEEAETLCDRVAVMSKGKIITAGTPQTLMEQAGGIAVDIINDGARFTRIFSSASDLDEYLAMNDLISYKVRNLRLEDVLISIQEEGA